MLSCCQRVSSRSRPRFAARRDEPGWRPVRAGVMVVWFAALAALGLWEIAQNPYVLLALSPSYGLWLCIQHKGLAFIVLGRCSIVTGAEALYADMGHFGARPIRLTWTFCVLPALVLNLLRPRCVNSQSPRSTGQSVLLDGTAAAPTADSTEMPG